MARKKAYDVDEIIKDLEERQRGVKDLLTEIKDLSELMVDLAYSAVLFNNDDLAELVKELEEEINKLRYEVEIKVILAGTTQKEAVKLAGILKVASAMENISNSAYRLAEIVLRDLDIHPALREGLQEAEEVFDVIQAKKKSKAVGKAFKEIEKLTKVNIRSLKRNGMWTIKVDDKEKLGINDTLIVAGTKDAISSIKELTK